MVVLVLAGAPAVASACALWCPAEAPRADAASARPGEDDATSAARACATQHGHDVPVGPAAGSASPIDETSPGAPADAAVPLTHPAAPIAASGACCDVPIVEASRVAASIEASAAHAPPLRALRLDVRDRSGPPRVAAREASPTPAVALAARSLVLRI